MTRQTLNLLGVLVVVAVLAAGLLLGALPRWQAAGEAQDERDTVAQQNDTQQLLIDSTRAKEADLPELRAQVAALQEQVPTDVDLEQVVELGVAAERGGARLRRVAPVVDEAAQASAATGGEGAGPATTLVEVPVELVFDVASPRNATGVVDALRDGPRRLVVDHVSLAGSESGGSTEEQQTSLTVTGRVFVHPGADQ